MSRARSGGRLRPGAGKGGELVAQEQVLGHQVGAAGQHGAERPEEQDEEFKHALEDAGSGTHTAFCRPTALQDLLAADRDGLQDRGRFGSRPADIPNRKTYRQRPPIVSSVSSTRQRVPTRARCGRAASTKRGVKAWTRS